MTAPAAKAAHTEEALSIARRFVKARLDASALPGFPGRIPGAMADSYAVQDTAIELWPDTIAGWKVGRIAAELHDQLGADRLAGPIFSKSVQPAGGTVEAPVFTGGFGAVEAEFVYRLAEDAPEDKTQWTAEEALAIVDAMFVGVEIASSPLATINQLGPLVVASDFGNNNGLILGLEIPNWRDRADESLTCETIIDGVSVGQGSAASLPGGPVASLVFLLGNCAARGRPLKKGALVSTGAATGVHDIEAGQTARISFGDLGEINCIAQPARPSEGSGGNNDRRDD